MKRTRAYVYGCFAPLFLSLLLGEGLSAPFRQSPPASWTDQEIKSQLLKLPGRVLARGRNSQPTGHDRVTTYLIEEVTLPRSMKVEIRGKTELVTRAFRVTIFGGPFHLRAMPALIGIGDEVVGVGVEHPKLDAVTAVTFDRSLLREGATLHFGYGADSTELPEKLTLKWPSAVERTKYVGLRHGGLLPTGLKGLGGSLVSGLNETKEYGISEVRKGRERMLWFEYLTHRDPGGAPYWEVKDVLVLPGIRRNQVLVYSVCFSGQKADSEIVAIADYQREVEFFTRVRRAWRANRSVEKFEEISPRGVKCTNEGYGV